MPAPRKRMSIKPRTAAALYRLLAWLSPSFPTGAFSYSHGLEAAAANGAIHDRASLQAWIAAIVEHGSGRIDADILREAYRAALAEDAAALNAANIWVLRLPAAFGVAAARAGIALEDALLGYLQAFAANLMSAGLRLGIIGQTDGQRILAALEPVVAAAAQAALDRDPADFGSATFAVDLASMAHETQYSRLFRS